MITDRTDQDVDRVKVLMAKAWQDMTPEEQAEWSSPMKGAYNHTDLNRVGGALNYVRDRLVNAGYLQQSVFTAKTDWIVDDIPTFAEMADYLRYIPIVREALAQFPTTPSAPRDADEFDYNVANDIEKILVDVDELITRMAAAAFYSGDLFSGEG